MFQRLLMLILCAFKIPNQRGQMCRLNTRIHFSEPLPIILKDGQLLEPTDMHGNIDIQNGETLTLSCGGSGYITHPQTTHEEVTANITCEGGDHFVNNDWLNGPATFSMFGCTTPPDYVSQRTNRTCFEDNPVIEVGYRVHNEFYPVYESCFNEDTLNAVYSKYTQKPYNANYQTKVERPYFIANNNFGSVPVERLYSPGGLKSAVAELVGPAIDRYFTFNETLSRGHLAAKTDFVFAFGERATFHYVNCAPQWKGFNGGNWNTLEVDLRNHIHAAGYDTIVYTGTYGVTQLFNQYGRRVDIYLYSDRNNNPVIPVPQYYYKVVYEPSTKRGIAYLGINNPYYTVAEARDMFFCEDICRGGGNFSWLSWHPNNSQEGYTFCCTVPDFRATVRHLPHFEVTGVLS